MQIDSGELDRLRRMEVHLKEIEAKEKEVRKFREDWDRKKDASLAAKKLFDEHSAVLQDMIAQAENPQMRLPFDGKDPATKEAEPVTLGWEAVPIKGLAIGKGLTKLLVEHGIKTMGKLEERRKDHGRALDLHGIGASHADTINTAFDDWLRANRDKAVFDAAAGHGLGVVRVDEDDPGEEVARYFKLAVDVKAGEVTHPSGGIFKVAQEMGGNRIALYSAIGSLDIFAVDEAEGAFVSVELKIKRIRLVKEVPGWDPATSGFKVGSEFEVLQWHGEGVLVAHNDSEVLLPPGDWEAVDPELIELGTAEADSTEDAE